MMSEQKQSEGAQAILLHVQDEMVKQAEKLVIELNLSKGEGLSKGRTQASKALEVAQSAGSLRVFINWLRYQAGRERPNDKFWSKENKHEKDGQKKDKKEISLAEAVAYELGRLQQKVGQKLIGDSAQNEVIMQAVTRFLGYFRRALIGADYLNEIQLAELPNTEEGK